MKVARTMKAVGRKRPVSGTPLRVVPGFAGNPGCREAARDNCPGGPVSADKLSNIMPVKQTKLKSGKVRVSTPNGVTSKATTPDKAAAQTRRKRWSPP